MDDRDLVLDALPLSPGGERPHGIVRARSVPDGELWARFCERLLALGGEALTVEDLAGFEGRSTWDPDVPSFVQRALGTPVEDVWAAEVGVTMCEAAVAETGSVLMASQPGRSRLRSLSPPIHVVLVRPEQLVPGLEEALTRLPQATCWLVSGPSRTADIEQVLVNGVHGPGRLGVVLLPDQLPE